MTPSMRIHILMPINIMYCNRFSDIRCILLVSVSLSICYEVHFVGVLVWCYVRSGVYISVA